MCFLERTKVYEFEEIEKHCWFEEIKTPNLYMLLTADCCGDGYVMMASGYIMTANACLAMKGIAKMAWKTDQKRICDYTTKATNLIVLPFPPLVPQGCILKKSRKSLGPFWFL